MQIYALPSVFIKRYKTEMLIVNTVSHCVFIVNDIAADIIQIIYNKKNLELADLINLVKTIDSETINEFIIELIECEIVGSSLEITKQQNKLNNNSSNFSYDEDIEADFQLNFIKENKLYAALLELTYRCNLRCLHCYAVEHDIIHKELSTKQVLNILDQLYDIGVFRLTFTGGEIFIRDDALTIIDYAYKKGFLIDIFSNATLLNEQKIKALASCYIRSFQVSLYSYKSSVHDYITGVKGSFDQTLKMLKLLKKYGISINIKSVMMKENSDDYKGLEKLADELGASFQTSLYIIPHNNGCKDNLNCRIKNVDDIEKILSYDLARTNAKSYYKKRNKKDVICNMGKSGISINPFGDIFPCNLLKIKLGNCISEKICDIWNNSIKLHEIRKLCISNLFNCSMCDKIDYCFFCPGAALAETGNMLLPYDEACSIAEIKKNLNIQQI